MLPGETLAASLRTLVPHVVLPAKCTEPIGHSHYHMLPIVQIQGVVAGMAGKMAGVEWQALNAYLMYRVLSTTRLLSATSVQHQALSSGFRTKYLFHALEDLFFVGRLLARTIC